MPLRKTIARARGLPVVLTIGHSTRSLAEFIALLRAHAVSRVADVRTIPRSWHNPQFNQDTLPQALRNAGVGYIHLPGLGGLRHARRDSTNGGWRNASFRGYADYMQTPEFAASLEELIRLAARDRIALMCAEAVPWRCHRALIADALLVRGIRTEDIMSLTLRQAHTLTSFAKVRGTTVTYPADAEANKLPLKRAAGRRSSRPGSARVPAAPSKSSAEHRKAQPVERRRSPATCFAPARPAQPGKLGRVGPARAKGRLKSKQGN